MSVGICNGLGEDVVVDAAGRFRLVSTRVGALPLINSFFDRLGLPALLEELVPVTDPRVKLAPADAVRLVVTNLLIGREPIYGLGEWAARYRADLLGLTAADVAVLNDDRVGRALDALFDADRASLLTAVVLAAVRGFGVDTSRLHNDSTSIAVSGAYRTARGQPRHGTPTPVITFGHSKDRRPDLKQLVWILTVAADGAVPVAYRLADGNTEDSVTHIPTWNELVDLLGTPGFCYVADSKLCTGTAMRHINSHGGRFITVLPRSRAEDRYFRDWLQTHTPAWAEATRVPGARLDDPDDVCCTCPAPLPSAEGFRIVWVHSTGKARNDAASRNKRLQAAAAALDELAAKLVGPRCRIRTRGAIEAAVLDILADTGTARWVSYRIQPTITVEYKAITRGRPGPQTRYRQIEHHRYQLTHDLDLATIGYDAASDGCYPLITNARLHDLADAEVLANYRYQPNLERRHHILKSVQDAAPVLLKSPARIEALFCCQFLALLVSALIERQIRAGMRDAKTSKIPLYPELRGCAAPSTERILEIFADTAHHHLYEHDQLVQTFPPELTPLQQQVLQLAGLPADSYTTRPAPAGN
jgi:hypothetical protein